MGSPLLRMDLLTAHGSLPDRSLLFNDLHVRFMGRVPGIRSRFEPQNLLNENQCSESVFCVLTPILNTEHHRRSRGRAGPAQAHRARPRKSP